MQKKFYIETDRFIVYLKAEDIYSDEMMLKLDLILQIMNQKDHFQMEKIRK